MNVLIVCASGMSSSVITQRMREEAKKRYPEVKVGACGSSQLHSYVSKADFVFVAPQTSWLKEEIEQTYHVSCMTIPETVYADMDGAALLDLMFKPHEEENREPDKSRIRKAAEKFAGNRYVLSVMDGFQMLIPVSMIGSVFSLLLALPIPYISTWISESILGDILETGIQMTLGMISLYLTICIAFCFAERRNIRKEGPVLASVLDLIAVNGVTSKGYLDVAGFDGKGMLSAVLFTALTLKIYMSVSDRIQHKVKGYLAENIAESFYSILPVTACLMVTLGISGLFMYFTGMHFTQWASSLLTERIGASVGTGASSMLALNEIALVLWFFSIHGGKIIATIRDPIFKPMSMANLNAWRNGQPLPYICTNQSVNMFVFGGAGSTLALAFLMAFFAKSEKMKKLGKISFPMGIFFINEPLLFGVPFVFNASMLLPFMMIPFVSGVLTLTLTDLGVLPYLTGIEMPWTTPPLISGLLQGGWRMMVWQGVLLVLQTLMWYPFFRKMDRKACVEEQKS